MRMPVVLLLSLFLDSQETPSTDVSLKKLLDSLREASADRYTILYAFAAQENAPAGIPSLLGLMKSEAPRQDNDVCLAVLAILEKHPSANCPLDPLLDAVRRRQWTSQQKGSLVLYEALRDEDAWKGRKAELSSALIPLLTSQRSRVYASALKCLKKITGQTLGPDADAWKKYYETTYPGKALDLGASIHEVLAVIRPTEEDPVTFAINGERAVDGNELAESLVQLRRNAQDRGLALSIVIQAPGDIEDERGEYPASVKKAIQAVLKYVALVREKHFSYTVSPGSDVFRAPYGSKGTSRTAREY